MIEKLTILPLRLTPHTDRTSILSAYSREHGAVTFAVAAGSGAGAARRRALLRPLAPVECIASGRNFGEILRMKEPRPLMTLHGIDADPVRCALTLFLAEALGIILKQSDGEPALFDFIVSAIERLDDASTPTANFHLSFLVGLGALTGISPDTEAYRPGMIFDMAEGRFRHSAALHGHCLSPAESAAAAALCRIDMDNMGRFRYSRLERARALEGVLEYYSLHLADMTSMKSPAILRAVLG